MEQSLSFNLFKAIDKIENRPKSVFFKMPIFLHECALCVKLASSISTTSITYSAPAQAYLWFSILRNDANLFLYTLGGGIKREKCKQNSFFLIQKSIQ